MTTDEKAPNNRAALISVGLVLLFMGGAAFGVYKWLVVAPEFEIDLRLTDVIAETKAGTMGGGIGGGESIDLVGTFADFEVTEIAQSQSWSHFRGDDFSNIIDGKIPLADSWPAEGPPVLWSIELGEGHAGAAVYKGKVYVLDYDEEQKGDALRTFSMETGEEIWRRTYQVSTKRNHGISRTIPAVTEKYTVTMGPRCHVMCVDTETGEYIWGIDLVAVYGSEVPLWYTGQCPLIDDGQAILAPGGQVRMMGVDIATGEVLWKVDNPKGWEMSHSSIIPMTLQGKRTYVYCSMGGIYGVSAEPEDRGTLLWSSKKWSHSVISPSPIQIDDSRIFLTAGYGTGSLMLEINKDGSGFSTEVLYELDVKQFGCEQQTPIFYKGLIYGIMPKDGAALKGQFVAMNPESKMVWTSGKTERFGLGPFLVADGKVYILNDNGELTMIRASTSKYEQLARHRVIENGHDAWAPMAMVDGKLILRDARHMICLDMRAR